MTDILSIHEVLRTQIEKVRKEYKPDSGMKTRDKIFGYCQIIKDTTTPDLIDNMFITLETMVNDMEFLEDTSSLGLSQTVNGMSRLEAGVKVLDRFMEGRYKPEYDEMTCDDFMALSGNEEAKQHQLYKSALATRGMLHFKLYGLTKSTIPELASGFLESSISDLEKATRIKILDDCKDFTSVFLLGKAYLEGGKREAAYEKFTSLRAEINSGHDYWNDMLSEVHSLMEEFPEHDATLENMMADVRDYAEMFQYNDNDPVRNAEHFLDVAERYKKVLLKFEDDEDASAALADNYYSLGEELGAAWLMHNQPDYREDAKKYTMRAIGIYTELLYNLETLKEPDEDDDLVEFDQEKIDESRQTYLYQRAKSYRRYDELLYGEGPGTIEYLEKAEEDLLELKEIRGQNEMLRHEGLYFLADVAHKLNRYDIARYYYTLFLQETGTFNYKHSEVQDGPQTWVDHTLVQDAFENLCSIADMDNLPKREDLAKAAPLKADNTIFSLN